MYKGEELVRDLEEKIVHMVGAYHMYRRHTPEYKEAVDDARKSRKSLLDYIAGIEKYISDISESMNAREEELDDMSYPPEDFDIHKEHMDIIDEINREGFASFEDELAKEE